MHEQSGRPVGGAHRREGPVQPNSHDESFGFILAEWGYAGIWDGIGWLAAEALGLVLGLLVGIWPGQASLSDSLLFAAIVAPTIYGIVVFRRVVSGLVVMCMEGLFWLVRFAPRVISTSK